DTGNNTQIFEHNVKAAGVDLRTLDFVVMSHRHGDHMGGLAYLLKVNPTVKIYAPKERSGVYGDDRPSSTWYRKDASLPAEQRYYRGAPPEMIHMGAAWPGANFQLIDGNTEIAPGMYLIALVSDTPGTLEVHELSLAIRTPDGLVLVVGCSHPGVEHIMQEASAIDPHVKILLGGLHQIQATDPEVERIAKVHDQYKVERVAPGHCTGEPEFVALKKTLAITTCTQASDQLLICPSKDVWRRAFLRGAGRLGFRPSNGQTGSDSTCPGSPLTGKIGWVIDSQLITCKD